MSLFSSTQTEKKKKQAGLIVDITQASQALPELQDFCYAVN
jgi:hypothetical protein